MKYYIVSEEELESRTSKAKRITACYIVDMTYEQILEAEAACRAREVPEDATHFVQNLDGPLDYGLYSIENDWEIKR